MTKKTINPDETSPDKQGPDFAIPIEATADGLRVIRHFPDHHIETGTLRKIENGKPIPEGSELVSLSITDHGYHIETLYKSDNSGPPKVNNSAFRSGWDRIFAHKEKKDLLN
ncbi:MAG TPA: hypothetical protein VIE65_21305 [Methylobacter sp.]|jgi:hypothetical protein